MLSSSKATKPPYQATPAPPPGSTVPDSQWTDLQVQLAQGSDLKVDPYNLEIVQTQHQVVVWDCQ